MSETGAAPENVKKAGTVIGRRTYLNLIEGANTTLTVADNSGTDSIDVTVASAAGGGGNVATDVIWDAAGDLAVGTGADAAARLGISVPAANILNVLGVVNGETTWSVKPVHDGTAPTTQALSDAAAAGTALTAAHRDHKHGMFANSAVLFGSLGDVVVAEVASNVTINNSSTLIDITGLTFNISASATEIWLIEYFLETTSVSATSDLKLGFAAVPAGATMRWGAVANSGFGGYSVIGAGSSSIAMLTASGTLATGSANATFGTGLAGKVLGGGTGGAIQIQFAQNTPTVENTVILAGSCMRATRIHT